METDLFRAAIITVSLLVGTTVIWLVVAWLTSVVHRISMLENWREANRGTAKDWNNWKNKLEEAANVRRGIQWHLNHGFIHDEEYPAAEVLELILEHLDIDLHTEDSVPAKTILVERDDDD